MFLARSIARPSRPCSKCALHTGSMVVTACSDRELRRDIEHRSALEQLSSRQIQRDLELSNRLRISCTGHELPDTGVTGHFLRAKRIILSPLSTSACCCVSAKMTPSLSHEGSHRSADERVGPPDIIHCIPACNHALPVSPEQKDHRHAPHHLGQARPNIVQRLVIGVVQLLLLVPPDCSGERRPPGAQHSSGQPRAFRPCLAGYTGSCSRSGSTGGRRPRDQGPRASHQEGLVESAETGRAMLQSSQ